MYETEQVADDLGIPAEPMRRLPPIVSILYEVRTSQASQWAIDAQTKDLRDNGFVVACQDETYDPLVGYKYEWWGYSKENME